MKKIIITKNVQELLKNHAKRSSPEECCGVLLGPTVNKATIIFPIKNVAPGDRKHNFFAWPELFSHMYEKLLPLGLFIVAMYHSHLTGDLRPSESDLLYAFYPKQAYVIVDPLNIRAWTMAEKIDKVFELEING